jgi:hypothetical protein
MSAASGLYPGPAIAKPYPGQVIAKPGMAGFAVTRVNALKWWPFAVA